MRHSFLTALQFSETGVWLHISTYGRTWRTSGRLGAGQSSPSPEPGLVSRGLLFYLSVSVSCTTLYLSLSCFLSKLLTLFPYLFPFLSHSLPLFSASAFAPLLITPIWCGLSDIRERNKRDTENRHAAQSSRTSLLLFLLFTHGLTKPPQPRR